MFLNKSICPKPYRPIFAEVNTLISARGSTLKVTLCDESECTGCFFNRRGHNCDSPRELLCTAYQREDNKQVKFIKV